MQDANPKNPQIKPKTAIIIFSVIMLILITELFIVQTLSINLKIIFMAIFFTIMLALIIYFWHIGRKALENKGNLSAWWLLYKKILPWVLVTFLIFSFIGCVQLYNAVIIGKLIEATYDQPDQPVEPTYNAISDLSNDCVTVIKHKGLPEDMINSCNYTTSIYWGNDDANSFVATYYGKDINNVAIKYGPPINCSPSFCEYHEVSVTIWPDGKITDGK